MSRLRDHIDRLHHRSHPDPVVAAAVLAEALSGGALHGPDVRRAVAALHRARETASQPAALALVDALDAAVGARVAGAAGDGPFDLWGLESALAGHTEDGVASLNTSSRFDQAWLVQCSSVGRAQALVDRLHEEGLSEVSTDRRGAQVRVDRRVTQRSAASCWRELGLSEVPVDGEGVLRPLTDSEVSRAIEAWTDRFAQGCVISADGMPRRFVALVDYVYGVDASGVRGCHRPALSAVAGGDSYTYTPAVMVDDPEELLRLVEDFAASLDLAPADLRIEVDDDRFELLVGVRGRSPLTVSRDQLRAVLTRAGFNIRLSLGSGPSGWNGGLVAYTSRARISEVARCNTLLLDALPRSGARVIYLGRAGASLYFADAIEHALSGRPHDGRLFLLSRHNAPPRLIALVRGIINAVVYGGRARDEPFSVRAAHGRDLDAHVLEGLAAEAAVDPAIAADLRTLHEMAVGANLLDGLGDGDEVLIFDECALGTFPLMLKYALENPPPHSASPVVRVSWFTGGNPSLNTDYSRLEPEALVASYGWPGARRVVEAVSAQAEFLPHPIGGPRPRGERGVDGGAAVELSSLRVQASAVAKNLWIYDGYLRAHRDLALIPLIAARDDPRAPATVRQRAGQLVARHAHSDAVHLYGLRL